MTKRKRSSSKPIFVLITLLLVFVGIMRMYEESNVDTASSIEKNDPFGEVKRYTPLIKRELEKYKLQDYTIVLIALMQQESKGKGGDPLQASESAGLAPNTINSPELSIRQGVKHFQQTVKYGKQKKVDFPTIIQAYNMGSGYINFVSQNGGKHSEELAKKFSMSQVKKKPQVYNCRGDKNNFRYPYCYGDFTYNTKVAKNIESLAASIPEANRSTGGAF